MTVRELANDLLAAAAVPRQLTDLTSAHVSGTILADARRNTGSRDVQALRAVRYHGIPPPLHLALCFP
jgi:hypothetical protein